MVTLWRVSRIGRDDPLPLFMKVPRIKGGDDPDHGGRLRGRADDPAGAVGARAPFIARSDFTGSLHRDERIPGDTLRAHRRAPLPVAEVVDIG
jgi:hypothetical protein